MDFDCLRLKQKEMTDCTEADEVGSVRLNTTRKSPLRGLTHDRLICNQGMEVAALYSKANTAYLL